MLDYLIARDTELLLAVNGMNSPFFDSFMELYSGRFIWIPMYVAIFYVMLRTFGVRKAVIIGLGVGLAIFIADQTCASLLRPYFQRLRPSNIENELSPLVHIVNGHRGGAYGFPSCHAANTFTLAVLMSLLLPKRAFVITLFLWALLTCYSRSYLGVHYPGDLLAGAVVGTLSACLCYALVRWLAFHGKKTSAFIENRPGVLMRKDDGSVLFAISPVGVFIFVALATVAYIVVISLLTL